MADGTGLTATILRDEAALPALRGDWEALARHAVGRTPFMGFDWLECGWQRHRSDHGVRPHIVTVRQDGRLVLAAPFRAHRTLAGLSWLGWLDSRTPAYNDIVMEDSDAGRAARTVMWRMVWRDPAIYRMRLDWVRDDAAIVPCLAAAGARRSAASQAPFVAMTAFSGWEAFRAGLSRNLRSQHGRTVRQLAGNGMEFGILTAWPDIETPFDWLFARKREWVEQRPGIDPWFIAEGTRTFFREIASRAAARGELWFPLIRRHGEIVAAAMFFVQVGTLYLSKLAHNPAMQQTSPGRTMILMTIEEAFRRGLTRTDLMIGNPSWKQRIASQAAGVSHYKVRAGLLRRRGMAA